MKSWAIEYHGIAFVAAETEAEAREAFDEDQWYHLYEEIDEVKEDGEYED